MDMIYFMTIRRRYLKTVRTILYNLELNTRNQEKKNLQSTFGTKCIQEN